MAFVIIVFMKINLIGAGAGSGLSAHLQPMLLKRGYEAHINSVNIDYFDLNLYCGLWHLDWNTSMRNNPLTIPSIALAVGSDVYRDLDKLKNTIRDKINQLKLLCDEGEKIARARLQ